MRQDGAPDDHVRATDREPEYDFGPLKSLAVMLAALLLMGVIW